MLKEARRQRGRQPHPQVMLASRQPSEGLDEVLELCLPACLHREGLLCTLDHADEVVVLRWRDVVHPLMDTLYVHLNTLLYDRTQDGGS